MDFLICLPRLKSGATDILFLLDISQKRVIEHLQTSSTRGLLLFCHMTNFIISKSNSVSVLSVGHGLASYAHGSFFSISLLQEVNKSPRHVFQTVIRNY